MRSVSYVVAVVLALAQSPASQFAGTWTASLEGKTFARLELTDAGGKIGGRISLGAVHFGPGGDITAVNEPASNFTPIFDVALRNGTLTFSRKDGDETDRFELRLVNGNAQLTFVFSEADRAELAAQGVTSLKPTTLIRLR